MSPGHQPPAGTGPRAFTPVALVRTDRGWCVQSRAGDEAAGDLVEGLSLADLVAEELGVLIEPGRTARRSARGAGGSGDPAVDPVGARVAELERTVAQLEHALAARVSTERAIGVLAERNGTSARAAFESLRRDARSQGRPVAELAREVLDGLSDDAAAAPAADPPQPCDRSLSAPGRRRPDLVAASVTAPAPRPAAGPATVVTADGAS